MRPLIALAAVMLLIFAGWNQPYKDHLAALFPGLGWEPTRASQAALRNALSREEASASKPGANAVPGRAGASDRAWMFEENKMDRAQPASGQNKSR